MDMIDRHHLFLDQARYVVLDEADEMLDLGFLEDVESILRRAPMGRQTALFSATVPPEIRRLAAQFMHDPVEIKVRAATLTIDTVDQFYVETHDREKVDALVNVIQRERPTQAIVFARTKIGVDRLARRLGDAGVRVRALHGDMSQGQRDGGRCGQNATDHVVSPVGGASRQVRETLVDGVTSVPSHSVTQCQRRQGADPARDRTVTIVCGQRRAVT
jgi:superfamily II helicase